MQSMLVLEECGVKGLNEINNFIRCFLKALIALLHG